jgi:formylglycine-generating enzyme required for sulfatase activity
LSKIFICYRREDSAHAALAIYMRLEQHFGREHLFMDVDDIPLGVDFRDWLDRQIRQCDLVLVVMGRHWLTAEDANGQRRLDAPRDFVRTEIEIALERNIPLIPVLLDDAQMPDEAALPASIAPLAYRNAATVHAAGRHFRGHMEHLIRGIEWQLAQPPESAPETETEQQSIAPDIHFISIEGGADGAPAEQGLNQGQRNAIEHMQRKGRLTVADYMAAAQVSRYTATRGLHDLVIRGLVECRRGPHGAYFVTAGREDSPGPSGDDPRQDAQPAEAVAAGLNPRTPQAAHAESPELSSEIRQLLTEINNPATDPPRRLAIGDSLAELGDPRPGVGLRPDGLPDIAWVEIPATPLTWQSWQSWQSVGRRRLPTYWIAKYPLTNAQFQCFIDDGGYREDRWWQFTKPPVLELPRWPQGNRPRTAVDWYEALAFCRWLTAWLGLSEGSIRLPTELEWQKAARGKKGFDYPWGTEYRSGFANVDETAEPNAGPWYLEQTTAVGVYPHGRSPYGVEDLAGTVWEWCVNRYETPAATTLDNSGAARALRGGSWSNPPGSARAVVRLRYRPDIRDTCWGFRLASSVPIDAVR